MVKVKQEAGRASGQDRRGEILRMASEIFAEKGFVSATVRDIADAAGILSGSLYHHFDSKEAMLEEFLKGMLQGLVSQYEAVLAEDADASATLRAMIGIGLRSVVETPEGIKILHNDYGYLSQTERFAFVDDEGDRIMEQWVTALRRGIDSGDFRSDVDSRIAYRMIIGAIFSSVRWFRPDGSVSVDELADVFTQMYVDGLRA